MIAEKITYIPKGGMCANCKNKDNVEFCKQLNFESMPKICKGDSDGFVIVRCSEFINLTGA